MIDKITSPALHRNAMRILINQRQYTFNVDSKATKPEVKQWVEAVFGVKVISINSKHQPRKQKRRGRRIGYPVRSKLMIVTLRKNTTEDK